MVAPPAGTGSAGLLTYWTATSTVSSSLSLFWDNPNIRLGIGTSQPSSTLHIIAGTTGATTLQLMGLPNQTGNLLSIGSSSGQRWFTLSSLGLASSTEFRSPSSTIDVLTLTGNGLFSGSNVSIAPNTTSTSLVFIQGTTVSSTTLNIFGTTSQTASLLTISSSTGIPLFNINAIGQIGIATSTYPASSTLLTIASSSQIFNISSGGNVMIGTSTSPNGALLHIATTTNIFTILNSGNLGIGTISPFSRIHIAGNPIPIASSSLFLLGDNFISGGSTTGTFLGINATSGLTGFDFLNFQVNSSTKLLVAGDTGAIGLGTSTIPTGSLFTIATSSQIFNISAGGNIMIGTSTAANGALFTIATTTNILTVSSNGNLTLTGGRITFPATQSASTNANTLDDYEEGTWTPIIGGSGGESGQAYSVQNGTYIKIGRLVFVAFRVVLSTEGTITGDARIKGLPFATNAESIFGGGSVGYFVGLATNKVFLHFFNNSPGGTSFDISGMAAAASTPTSLTATDIGNTTEINGTIIYTTAN